MAFCYGSAIATKSVTITSVKLCHYVHVSTVPCVFSRVDLSRTLSEMLRSDNEI